MPEVNGLPSVSANAETDHEMLQKWLDHSITTTKPFSKLALDENTVKFLMYACEVLKLERDVFFMSVEMTGKYLELTKRNQIRIKDPILTVTVLIFICNKLVGQRSNLSVSSVLIFLLKSGLKHCTKNAIETTDREIAKLFNFCFPSLSSVDEINILIEALVEPEDIIKPIRKQCLDLFSLIYLHWDAVNDTLNDVYSKDEECKTTLKSLRESKLYFPAGILLCAVKMCKSTNFICYDTTRANVANRIKIEESDLNLLATTIYYVVTEILKDPTK